MITLEQAMEIAKREFPKTEEFKECRGLDEVEIESVSEYENEFLFYYAEPSWFADMINKRVAEGLPGGFWCPPLPIVNKTDGKLTVAAQWPKEEGLRGFIGHYFFCDTVADIIRTMKQFSEGNFMPPIDGVVYGFAINGEQCEIFDTVEDDDYRTETFDSVESALDGFTVNGKPLSQYAGRLWIEPHLVLANHG